MKEEIFNNILSEINNRIEKLALQIKEVLIRQVKDVLEKENKNVTGQLMRSIEGDVKRITEGILVEIYSGTGYAYYVHEGTRPHFPPVYALRDWVRLKGLAFRDSGKRILSYKSAKDYWKVDRLAYAIAWKIYHHGTKGLKFFDLALKQAEARINDLINNFRLQT